MHTIRNDYKCLPEADVIDTKMTDQALHAKITPNASSSNTQ